MDDCTVFVVDDDPAMRESLKFLMDSVGIGVETFESAQDFLDRYQPERPGCLVLDVRMPGMSGLDLQEVLAHRGILVPVIIITGYGDVPMAVRAMKGGALDFIEKPFTDQALLDKVNTALEIDKTWRREGKEMAHVEERHDRLTDREKEVMEKVLVGKPNKVIASELGLSHKTVEVHRSRVMDKMEVQSLADLLRTVILYRARTGRLT